MEDTHMVDSIKIEKLILILAIVFSCAYKTGELKALEKPIVIKKHGRKAKSTFRLGLDTIRGFLHRLDEYIAPYLSLLEYFMPLKQGESAI